MRRHAIRVAAIAALVALSAQAEAVITITSNNVDASGASGVTQGANSAPPVFYYSNIFASDGNTPPTFVGNAGGACNQNLNGHCHSAADLFKLTFTSTTAQTAGTPTMY